MVTLLLDAVKGWLPVVLVQWYGKPLWPAGRHQGHGGSGGVSGHLFPVFFRFEGGKGVATALGVLLGVIHWALGLLTQLAGWPWRHCSGIRPWRRWWRR